jgi:hypothetical protein
MVNLEDLTARSLRHYELGRLRMALRIAIILVPIIAVCLLEPIGRETCACCAALLLAAAIWLRFRSRVGVESVTTGLLAGAVPLGAALVLTQLDPGCATAGPFSFCTAFSMVIGGAAGIVVALRERARGSLAGHWVLAGSIAILAASLGCARLGLASIAGVALGIIAGRVSMNAAKTA